MVSIKTTQQGLHEGWTRATFILRRHHLEELKALAYWERRTIKEVIDEALGAYLKGKKCSNSEVVEELKNKPSEIEQECSNNP
jgi:hypothetical protein